jgi:hypothetical protein
MRLHNPPHPGEILRELCLRPLGVTVTTAAAALGVWLIVPELNFEPVVRVLLDGRRWTMSNIELGDPLSTSLQPPSDASVTWTSQPAGIMRNDGRGQATPPTQATR